jgi:molybdopterin synthase sulfur carrier subunit
MAAVTLRLFASARLAAGTASAGFESATVGDLLDEAQRRFGPGFAEILAGSRVWRNGQEADPDEALAEGDEVAVLPPVSGG